MPMREDRPSIMLHKFLADNARPTEEEPPRSEDFWEYGTFRKAYYFFYGTLTDPSLLAKVLQLSEPPKTRPAMIVGYHTKL